MNTIEDPLVMYIVVREDLNMSAGKMCAQVGHCVQNLILNYVKIQVLYSKKNLDIVPEDLVVRAKITTDWLAHGSRKVVLKANLKEFEIIKSLFKDVVVVKDAGLTQVEAGSETAMCLWPIPKSLSPKEIKRLQVL